MENIGLRLDRVSCVEREIAAGYVDPDRVAPAEHAGDGENLDVELAGLAGLQVSWILVGARVPAIERADVEQASPTRRGRRR